MTAKQGRYTVDDTRSVNRLAFEVFHNVEEFVVHVRLSLEAHLDLVQVRKSIIEDGLLSLGYAWRRSSLLLWL